MKNLLWCIFCLFSLTACNLDVDSTPIPPTATLPPSFIHIDQGLEALTSYQVHMLLQYRGQHQGEAVGGKIEVLSQNQPPDLYYFMKADISRSRYNLPIGISEFLRVGSQVYFKQPTEPQWFLLTSSALKPIDLNLFDFNNIILLPSSLTGLPQTERLSNQPVNHYKFTEADLNQPDIKIYHATGDVWLAENNQYIVQYALTTTLEMLMPDPNINLISEGYLNIFYRVTDINQPITLTVPIVSSPALTMAVPTVGNSALVELPRLAEAQFTTSLGSVLEYTVPVTPAEATRFYREAIPPLGWEEINPSADKIKAMLSFTKDNQRLLVFITPEINQVKILLVLEIIPPKKH